MPDVCSQIFLKSRQNDLTRSPPPQARKGSLGSYHYRPRSRRPSVSIKIESAIAVPIGLCQVSLFNEMR